MNKISKYYPINFHVIDRNESLYDLTNFNIVSKYTFKDFVNYLGLTQSIIKNPIVNNYVNYINKSFILSNEVSINDIFDVSAMNNLIVNKYIHDQMIKYDINDLYNIDSIPINRDRGLYILNNLAQSKDNQYYLYPYIDFGLISPREVYQIAKKTNYKDIINYLCLRDFCFYQSMSMSNLNQINNIDINSISFQNNQIINRFLSGTTGVPIIDAGIRQMEIEGVIYSNVKYIMCWFLMNCLNVDKSLGQSIFYNKLFDFDGLLNQYVWNSINPNLEINISRYVTLNNLYDYIIKYLPELRYIDKQDVINWSTNYINYDYINSLNESNNLTKVDYFRPIINFTF
jgi:hypothetical protein